MNWNPRIFREWGLFIYKILPNVANELAKMVMAKFWNPQCEIPNYAPLRGTDYACSYFGQAMTGVLFKSHFSYRMGNGPLPLGTTGLDKIMAFKNTYKCRLRILPNPSEDSNQSNDFKESILIFVP